MAVYWNLAAICATERGAETFAAFFRDRGMPGPDGDSVPLEVGFTHHGEYWLVAVAPVGMNWGSPMGSDPRLTTPEALRAATAWFYQELRGAPPFCVALFGAEAYDWFLGEPFPFVDVGIAAGSGFIFERVAWEAVGRPEGAERFREAYLWWPPADLIEETARQS